MEEWNSFNWDNKNLNKYYYNLLFKKSNKEKWPSNNIILKKNKLEANNISVNKSNINKKRVSKSIYFTINKINSITLNLNIKNFNKTIISKNSIRNRKNIFFLKNIKFKNNKKQTNRNKIYKNEVSGFNKIISPYNIKKTNFKYAKLNIIQDKITDKTYCNNFKTTFRRFYKI